MSETEFLEKYDKNTYDRPSVAVDCVVFRYFQNNLQILLVKRTEQPFLNSYALPSGFALRGKSLEDIAIENTFKKTSLKLKDDQVEQLVTNSKPDRDPRGWSISVSYLCFMPPSKDDLALLENAVWADISYNSHLDQIKITVNNKIISNLAFDHKEILETAFCRVQGRFNYKPTVYHLLPTYNRLAIFRDLYLKFMDDNISQTTFNRKFKQYFIETKKEEQTQTRKAKLYRLNFKNIYR